MKKTGKEIIIIAIVAVILTVVGVYWLLPYADAMNTSYLKNLIKPFLVFIPAIGIFSYGLYFARKDNDESRALYNYRFLLFNIVVLITCCFIGIVSISILPILRNTIISGATTMTIAVIICYILYLYKKF